MEYMNYKAKNSAALESKPRVYFTCHPEDFERCFEKLSNDILKTHDCIIYYTPDMTFHIPDEYKATDLERMNLFVIPVSFRLLNTENRAMDEDLSYAQEKRIPILPVLIEPGLDEIYSRPDKFGNLQYLDTCGSDATAISYEEKLEKYLDSVLLGEKTAQEVRAAFDSYIFLSYRKIDRVYANELMRMIHKNPLCRSIAIWYDEFLTPGREFDEGIQKALEKSELFALLVTKNLLQKDNYVQRIEYPEARKAGKEIMPVDMESIGDERLKAEFAGDAPDCIDGKQEELFQKELLQTVRRIGLARDNHDPAHNFLIGLAYLNGIDVEVDREKAVELIISAAQAGLLQAMEKLEEMYRDAVGVERDYREAKKWAKRVVDYYMREYGEEHPDTLGALNSLSVIHVSLGEYQEAVALERRVYQLRCKVLGEEHPHTLGALIGMSVIYMGLGGYQTAAELAERAYQLECKVLGEEHPHTLAALSCLADACLRLGNYQKAVELEEKVYQLKRKALGEEHPETLTALNNLAVSYLKLGSCQKAVELEEKVYQLKCRVLGEEHPDTLKALSDLAMAYGDGGDYGKEAQLEEKVYALRCKVLGEEHRKTLVALNNLGFSYRESGDRKKALELLQKLYSISLRVLGEEDSLTKKTLRRLTEMSKQQAYTG